MQTLAVPPIHPYFQNIIYKSKDGRGLNCLEALINWVCLKIWQAYREFSDTIKGFPVAKDILYDFTNGHQVTIKQKDGNDAIYLDNIEVIFHKKLYYLNWGKNHGTEKVEVFNDDNGNYVIKETQTPPRKTNVWVINPNHKLQLQPCMAGTKVEFNKPQTIYFPESELPKNFENLRSGDEICFVNTSPFSYIVKKQ